jgi:hypothetical protein
VKNNIEPLVSKRRQIEQEAIDCAVTQGYRDPREDKDENKTLVDGDNRRFITQFISEVPYDKLRENNIKKVRVDKTRCVTHLIPNITRHGLKSPLIVEESKAHPGYYDILSGHNRRWCLQRMSFKIPVFVVSQNVNLTGNAVSPLSKLRQNVLTNGKNLTGQYNMDDSIVHIREAISLDPTFEGKNPTGKFPPRETPDDSFDFNDLMDEIYQDSGWFDYDSTRTKIYNKYRKAVGGQKVTDLSERDEITAVLANLGWDTGLRETGARKKFENHIDTDRKAFILPTDTNGRHFEEKISQYSEKLYLDPSFKKSVEENDIKFIDIITRVYKPSANKANLDGARDNFLQRVKKYDNYMQHIGCPLKIRHVVFPKQITNNPQDVMIEYNLMEAE